jgi:hypothetical protein
MVCSSGFRHIVDPNHEQPARQPNRRTLDGKAITVKTEPKMKRPIEIMIHYLLLPLLIAIGGLFIHELGHGIIACIFGGTITYFNIMPGIELYPGISYHPWNGFVAQIGYDLPHLTSFQKGFIDFMGSGATFFVAGIILFSLVVFKPHGNIRRILFLTAALFPLDILAYSIFPALGWRHWIIFGGRTAEPVNGAIAMGMPAYAYYFVLGLCILLYYGILGYRLRCARKK